MTQTKVNYEKKAFEKSYLLLENIMKVFYGKNTYSG